MYTKALHEGEIGEQLGNDRDSNGYLKGVELKVYKDQFINRVIGFREGKELVEIR